MKKEDLYFKKLTADEKQILLSLIAIEKITTLKIHTALANIDNISKFKDLSKIDFENFFGSSGSEIFEKFRQNLKFNFEKYFDFYSTSLIFCDDVYYPKELFSLYDFPFVIFYRGNKDLFLFKRKISIVGSRNNTSYSECALSEIVPHFVKNNFVTVSGLAHGVDALVHKKTIQNLGHTIGVIAHGHNTIYPEKNKYLYEEMEKKHLIISEYVPTSEIRKYKFLERNRLVATLGSGLLVTEAYEKSGTSKTVSFALDTGKTVFCLPGKFGDKNSFGVNEVIKEGGVLVNKLTDFNDELGF